MKVLLSIKPEYADKIFKGKKKYEFRRKIWKREGVTTAVVYASAPTKKVIGEFRIWRMIKETPITVWNAFGRWSDSGIGGEAFFNYFEGAEAGYAIEIYKPKLYDKPKELSDFGISRPPQNFMYIGGSE